MSLSVSLMVRSIGGLSPAAIVLSSAAQLAAAAHATTASARNRAPSERCRRVITLLPKERQPRQPAQVAHLVALPSDRRRWFTGFVASLDSSAQHGTKKG